MRITIAIPTAAGRLAYLEKSIASCVAEPNDNLEILVSDNSGGAAEKLALSFKDSRIRYIQPPRYLAMSPHWDFVLEHVTGDVVSFIGDDDAVMPGCISEVLAIISEYGLNPIQHSLAVYHWPDYPENHLANTITFLHEVGSDTAIKSPRIFLDATAKGSRRYFDGPMVYHNFVPSELLRSLTRDKVFFRRGSPDVYSAMAIALNVSNYITTNKLLTLFGKGVKANGACVRLNRKEGVEFMREVADLFPQRYDSRTVQLCVLDTFHHALETFAVPAETFPLDMRAHLLSAFAEGIRLAGLSNKLREVRTALTAAALHGCLGPVLQGVCAKIAGRIGLAPRDQLRIGLGAVQLPQRFRVPETVTDVHQAAHYLSYELERESSRG